MCERQNRFRVLALMMVFFHQRLHYANPWTTPRPSQLIELDQCLSSMDRSVGSCKNETEKSWVPSYYHQSCKWSAADQIYQGIISVLMYVCTTHNVRFSDCAVQIMHLHLHPLVPSSETVAMLQDQKGDSTP